MWTRFLDPIGPGTPAWLHFDLALESYQAASAKNMHNHSYHRFYNQRAAMKLALRKEGASESLIFEWCQSLKQQCLLPS
jgi:hypothetical protein